MSQAESVRLACALRRVFLADASSLADAPDDYLRRAAEVIAAERARRAREEGDLAAWIERRKGPAAPPPPVCAECRAPFEQGAPTIGGPDRVWCERCAWWREAVTS